MTTLRKLWQFLRFWFQKWKPGWPWARCWVCGDIFRRRHWWWPNPWECYCSPHCSHCARDHDDDDCYDGHIDDGLWEDSWDEDEDDGILYYGGDE